jgi:pimeloyl-ACP methyl ester carboxylesterase
LKLPKVSQFHLRLAAVLFAALIAAIIFVVRFASQLLVAQAEARFPPLGEYVLVDGTKLHFVRCGSGQPIVFLHGNDGTVRDFTMSLFDTLVRQYRLLAFDRPGHGYSENPPGKEATVDVQADLIHKALLQLAIHKPIVVAHSWSGALALNYALRFPDELKGIVLLAGVTFDAEGLNPIPEYYVVRLPIVNAILIPTCILTGKVRFEGILRRAFSPQVAPAKYVDAFTSLLLRPLELRSAARDEINLNSTLRKMEHEYRNMKIPVVIVTGDADTQVSASNQSYRLHQEIQQSKLIVLRNTGHEIQFAHPEAVADAIALILKMK